jgi:hypothetical protein
VLAAGAGAAAAFAAAFGAASRASAVADTPPPSDAELLSKALEVERLMVLAYERVFASGALSRGVQRAITVHLQHERSHAASVAAQLGRFGVAVSSTELSLKAASDLMAKHQVSGSLTELHTEHDCLKLLVDLESVAEGVHYTALKDLRRPALIRLSAQIMACEAQHWTVLSGLRNPGEYVKAVPWPYVFGTK